MLRVAVLNLQRVPKLRVLIICKIILVCVLEAFHCPTLVPLSVVPYAHISINDSKSCGYDGCDEDCDETGRVHRSIFRLEKQRPDKVTS